MFETKQTGVVRKNHEEAEFEFQIIDIFSIAEDECAFFKSPSFSFADALWHFELYHKPTFHPEFMKLGLTVDDPLKYKVEYQFGLKNIDGSLENLARGVLKDDDEWSDYCFFKLSDIQQRQSELAPSDIVTIKCMLKLARNQQDLSDEPKRKKQKNAESLCRDYKKLFFNSQNNDKSQNHVIIFKVGDKEFKVHRKILMARSSVFESMLSPNMLEKNIEVIKVDGCDPKAMEQFLLYMYCGEFENLDESTVLGLYRLADKYEMGALKEECCDLIKKSFSTTNISRIIQFAIDHDNSDLIEIAKEFLFNNYHNISKTVEWQSFVLSNFETFDELIFQCSDKQEDEKPLSCINGLV